MSTFTNSTTFTLTNAKYLASKISADLKRIQRFYGKPSDSVIEKYDLENQVLLNNGYLDEVSYGFKKDGDFIEPTLIYKAKSLLSDFAVDDDPGKVRPGANVEGASFSSFLTYSSKWYLLSKEERNQFESKLPFQRTTGSTPGINGKVVGDNTYSSGGKSLNRSSIKRN